MSSSSSSVLVPPIGSISAAQVADLVMERQEQFKQAQAQAQDRQTNKQFVIIDVRDHDREGGHIVGSVHVPSSSFEASVERIVKQYHQHQQVIFHCMLSQVRGPRAASLFHAHLRSCYPESSCHVMVLQKGFQGMALYASTHGIIQHVLDQWDEGNWDD